MAGEDNVCVPLYDILVNELLPVLKRDLFAANRRARLRVCSKAHYAADPDFKTPEFIAWNYSQYHGSPVGKECAKICAQLAWVGWDVWPEDRVGYSIYVGCIAPPRYDVSLSSRWLEVHQDDLAGTKVKNMYVHINKDAVGYTIHIRKELPCMAIDSTDSSESDEVEDDRIMRKGKRPVLRRFLRMLWPEHPRDVIRLKRLRHALDKCFPEHCVTLPLEQ
jgi:hypothetical protein